MPTPLMKSFAKEAHKKTKTVEKLWGKAEKIVQKKYDINDSSSRYWPLVVGVTKKLLGISKQELEEDGEITTTNMGSDNGQGAMFYQRVGTPMTRIDGDIQPVSIKKEKKKKNYDKYIKTIVAKVNEKAMKESIDDLFSDAIEHYSKKTNDVNDIVENALEYLGKRFGIEESIFDH